MLLRRTTLLIILASIFATLSPIPSFSSDFIPTSSDLRGYYSPVFNHEAQKAYYIQRDLSAWDWGPGWEFFTPPAYVRVETDSYQLIEHDLSTGNALTLASFPESPLAGKTHRHYRGGLFGYPKVIIRFEEETGNLEYEISVSIHTQPTSTNYRIFRWWNNATEEIETSSSWQQENNRMQGLNEDRLRGQKELIALPGPEGIPCAVINWNHETNDIHILAEGSEFREQYPDGISLEVLQKESRKERIEYLSAMRYDYERFYQSHLSAGLNDGNARLAANKDMQEAGYYPRTPTLTARLVNYEATDTKLPTFEVTQTEMESGIFDDIAQAIETPGKAIDYNGYSYITYSGYNTSQKLNEHLQTGALKYRVRYLGNTFEIVIVKPN